METGLKILVQSNDSSRYSLIPPVMVFICSIIIPDKSYNFTSNKD